MIELQISEAQLRRLVDGTVRDAFAMHPDYLAPAGRAAAGSIAKRVCGTIKGFAAQAAKGRAQLG